MSLKKDKEKVIDPVWGEERIREFLDLQPPEGENSDFHKLLKSYYSMRSEDFATFVGFFVEAGGDLDAVGAEGKTLVETIESHRYSGAYVEAVNRAR